MAPVVGPSRLNRPRILSNEFVESIARRPAEKVIEFRNTTLCDDAPSPSLGPGSVWPEPPSGGWTPPFVVLVEVRHEERRREEDRGVEGRRGGGGCRVGGFSQEVSVSQTHHVARRPPAALPLDVATTRGASRAPSRFGHASSSPSSPLSSQRGGCRFIDKVKNAQRLGASGVLIGNDRCVCSHSEGCAPSDEPCDSRLPTMSAPADFDGAAIEIPSLMIDRKDYATFHDYLTGNVGAGAIMVSMAWRMPVVSNDMVAWSLWSSVVDDYALDFGAAFGPVVGAIGARQLFVPHFSVRDGRQYGCTTNPAVCADMCTNGGRYCFPMQVRPSARPSNPAGVAGGGGALGRRACGRASRRRCLVSLAGSPLPKRPNRCAPLAVSA